MIRYSLNCPEGHEFESWFANIDAFDKLKASGHLCCEVCGSPGVEKALMAPQVQSSRSKDTTREKTFVEVVRAMAKQADDVGDNFASEVRAMHDGRSERRAVTGKATQKEYQDLIEDGYPVLPVLTEN